MTRKEHLEWSKQRALDYCDMGNPQDGFTSLMSDLGKHPETADHVGIQMGMKQMIGGFLDAPIAMRKFIESFN